MYKFKKYKNFMAKKYKNKINLYNDEISAKFFKIFQTNNCS